MPAPSSRSCGPVFTKNIEVRSCAGMAYMPSRKETCVTKPGPAARVVVCSRSNSASESSARSFATAVLTPPMFDV